MSIINEGLAPIALLNTTCLLEAEAPPPPKGEYLWFKKLTKEMKFHASCRSFQTKC